MDEENTELTASLDSIVAELRRQTGSNLDGLIAELGRLLEGCATNDPHESDSGKVPGLLLWTGEGSSAMSR